MRNLILSTLLLSGMWANAQQHNNMYQLSVYEDKNFTVSNKEEKYSSCWAWNGNGYECAVFGSRDFTYFLDVTNPATPKLILREAGAAKDVTWREYRTFGNYVYAVNDGANGTLQVFDMSDFPTKVTKVYDSNTLITRSHTLVIQDSILYLFGARNAGQGSFTLGMYSLKNNPASPELLAHYNNPSAMYIHDGIVKDGILYAFSGYDGLWVYDVKDPQNVQIVSSLQNYPAAGYCHSGSFSKDGKYLYMADEVPIRLPMKIFDISNPQNINFVDTFRAKPGYTPHNPFTKGDTLFISYYEEGVHVWDISKPDEPQPIANFDTYIRNNDANLTYNGCWNVYPYFPSGNIAAIDRKFGLYMLAFGATSGIQNIDVESIQAFPNPFSNQVRVQHNGFKNQRLSIEIYALDGKLIAQNEVQAQSEVLDIPNLEGLDKGMYFLKIQSPSQHYLCKLIK
jgi:choice-of-anchor B domain-containing protein